MNNDGFRFKRGSGLEGPSHHFCSAGSIREGSPDPIHFLTRSIGGLGGKPPYRAGKGRILCRPDMDANCWRSYGDREVKLRGHLYKFFLRGGGHGCNHRQYMINLILNLVEAL